MKRLTTLREQLMRAALMTTAAVLILSAAALLFYELQSWRKTWVSDLRTQARLLAKASVAALEFEDPEAGHDNLGSLSSQPRVTAAALYDADGALFAAYARPGASIGDRMPVLLAPDGFRFQGATLEVSYPIERAGKRLGTLYLSAQHDIGARLLGFAAILLGLGGAGLAVAFYLFGIFQRRITAPLESITQVAQEVIAGHNWALRAPNTHYRDLDVLVDGFNGILLECQSRTSELEREMVSRKAVEQQLRQADQAKDEFLATLAHELRNPLAPMTSAVALLQMAKTPPATRDKAVVVLDRQIKHMVRLINDLLDASRIATGKLSLDVELLDLCDLLTTVVDGMQSMAEQQGVALTLHVPGGMLCVEGDAVRLAQVFSNLLNNACRYTPPGGRVTVTVSGEADAVLVAVRDTGVGVAPAMQARIFELFAQADTSLERGNTGLGVGLTLSRQIVELHHGQLTMSSDGPGRGSCFVVRLPRRAHGAANDGPASGLRERQLRPLRILIADDNVDLADSFAELLRVGGHTVDVAHDGEAALRCAHATLPDIALLDIGMPRHDGYEVARQLRQSASTSHIHLVAISGWGQACDRDTALRAGFDQHLAKPVEPRELVRLLIEAFEAFEASRPGDLL